MLEIENENKPSIDTEMDDFTNKPKGIFKTFSEELHEDSDDTHPWRWLET